MKEKQKHNFFGKKIKTEAAFIVAIFISLFFVFAGPVLAYSPTCNDKNTANTPCSSTQVCYQGTCEDPQALGLSSGSPTGTCGTTNTQLIIKIQTAVGMTGDDIDGICGPYTLTAIQVYQQQNGLATDGVISAGNPTDKALGNILEGSTPPPGGSGGSGALGSPCTNGSTCQTNYCNTTSGNAASYYCDYCTATSCGTGYTCSSGTCVASGTGTNPPTGSNTGCPPGTTVAAGGICLPSSGVPNTGIAGQSTLAGLILQIITILLTFAGLIAVVMIVIGGFQYITAAGNEENSEKGKKALVNAVIGLVVVLLAFAIVRIVSTTLTSNSVLPTGTGMANSRML